MPIDFLVYNELFSLSPIKFSLILLLTFYSTPKDDYLQTSFKSNYVDLIVSLSNYILLL